MSMKHKLSLKDEKMDEIVWKQSALERISPNVRRNDKQLLKIM
jgi:hypothetical protein